MLITRQTRDPMWPLRSLLLAIGLTGCVSDPSASTDDDQPDASHAEPADAGHDAGRVEADQGAADASPPDAEIQDVGLSDMSGACDPAACEAQADPCLEARCAADGQTCQMTPLPDGQPCDDGDPDTVGDRCASGICEGLADPPELLLAAQMSTQSVDVFKLAPEGDGHRIEVLMERLPWSGPHAFSWRLDGDDLLIKHGRHLMRLDRATGRHRTLHGHLPQYALFDEMAPLANGLVSHSPYRDFAHTFRLDHARPLARFGLFSDRPLESSQPAFLGSRHLVLRSEEDDREFEAHALIHLPASQPQRFTLEAGTRYHTVAGDWLLYRSPEFRGVAAFNLQTLEEADIRPFEIAAPGVAYPHAHVRDPSGRWLVAEGVGGPPPAVRQEVAWIFDTETSQLRHRPFSVDQQPWSADPVFAPDGPVMAVKQGGRLHWIRLDLDPPEGTTPLWAPFPDGEGVEVHRIEAASATHNTVIYRAAFSDRHHLWHSLEAEGPPVQVLDGDYRVVAQEPDGSAAWFAPEDDDETHLIRLSFSDPTDVVRIETPGSVRQALWTPEGWLFAAQRPTSRGAVILRTTAAGPEILSELPEQRSNTGSDWRFIAHPGLNTFVARFVSQFYAVNPEAPGAPELILEMPRISLTALDPTHNRLLVMTWRNEVRSARLDGADAPSGAAIYTYPDEVLGGLRSAFSSDGRWLITWHPDQQMLQSLDTHTVARASISLGDYADTEFEFIDPQSLLVWQTSPEGRLVTLERLTLQPGAPIASTSWAELEPLAHLRVTQVSSQGVLLTPPDPEAPDPQVFLTWPPSEPIELQTPDEVRFWCHTPDNLLFRRAEPPYGLWQVTLSDPEQQGAVMVDDPISLEGVEGCPALPAVPTLEEAPRTWPDQQQPPQAVFSVNAFTGGSQQITSAFDSGPELFELDEGLTRFALLQDGHGPSGRLLVAPTEPADGPAPMFPLVTLPAFKVIEVLKVLQP